MMALVFSFVSIGSLTDPGSEKDKFFLDDYCCQTLKSRGYFQKIPPLKKLCPKKIWCTDSFSYDACNEIKASKQCDSTVGVKFCRYTCNKCASNDKMGLEKSAILSNYGKNSYFKDLLGYLAPVLKNPSKSRWQRCWHAATDGWAASKFHGQCDGKGPTVTLVRVGNYVFGGYSDIPWHSRGTYSTSTRSFLFSLYNINGYQPIKLTLNGKYNQDAIKGASNYGPTFGGGHDLHISDNASSNSQSYTNTNFSYYAPPGKFFAGSKNFTPNDVEVFYETT